MGYVGWGLVAEQANTTTGGAQRTVGITSSPGAGIAQSSLNSVNNGGGGVVNNYGAVWDNLFVRQYLFGRGEQGAWFDPSDFQPNWRRNLLTWTEQFDNAVWPKSNSFIQTNLLTWSEQFDNAIWSKQTNVTIVANVVIAPDGTTTADRVDWASAAINTGVLQTGIPINGAPNTKSIYVRADSAGGTIQLADPNLTVGITTATLTTDWQRIVLSEPAGSQPTNAGLWVRKTASSPSSIYIWGAQLVQGSVPGDYQQTTSAAAAVQYAAPDGTITAEKLVEGATTSRKYINQTGATLNQTFSVYVQKGERDYVAIGQTNGSGLWAVSLFNLNLGTYVASYEAGGSALPTNNTIISVVGNWYKISCTLNGGGGLSFPVIMVSNGGNPIFEGYTGNGSSGIYIWGAQLEVGSTATAYQPITNGVQDYFTYQPQPILYQDSSGVTPVTALEQPCGLMLDKSKGLQLGPELVVNGDFSQGSTGWSVGAGWSVSGGAAVATASNAVLSQNSVFTSGKWYRISFTQTYTSGSLQIRINGVQSIGFPSYSGTIVQYVYATASGSFEFVGTSLTSIIDNISVRELPGNHAYQTTSAKRPVVSARVNLLTYTEQFDNAAWNAIVGGLGSTPTRTGNFALAPNGTMTATRLQFSLGGGTTTSDTAYISQSVTMSSSSVIEVWLKSNTASNYDVYLRTQNTGVTVTVTPSWQKFSLTGALAAGVLHGFGLRGGQTPANSNTADILAWGADLRPADQATGIMPRYQRVGAATFGTSTAAGVADYDSVGFPVYLRTDGIDDAMLTNSIDFNTVTSDGLPRRNLLDNPTQFDAAYWTKIDATVTANATTAPDGTGTADKLIASATAGRHIAFRQPIGVGALNTSTVSCYAKASEYGFLALSVIQGSNSSGILYTFDLIDGTANQRTVGSYNNVSASAQLVGNGWWRCSITFTNAGATADHLIIAPSPSATPSIDLGYKTPSYTGDGTSGIFIWGAQVEVGSTATAFQNIGTDQVTVFAGVRKLSDALTGVVAEISVQAALNNGAFLLTAPGQNGASSYRFHSRGTVEAIAGAGVFAAAPDTAVLTGIGNISGDVATIRRNGSVVDTNTADQGTGNYGNYPLYLFARNQASNFFTGNFYGLIVRGAQTDTSLITTTEEYIANVTGFGAPVVVGTPSIGVSI